MRAGSPPIGNGFYKRNPIRSMPERQPSNDPVQWHSAMEQGCASDRSHVPSTNYLAHVRRNDDGSFDIHELEEHLSLVYSHNPESLNK